MDPRSRRTWITKEITPRIEEPEEPEENVGPSKLVMQRVKYVEEDKNYLTLHMEKPPDENKTAQMENFPVADIERTSPDSNITEIVYKGNHRSFKMVSENDNDD